MNDLVYPIIYGLFSFLTLITTILLNKQNRKADVVRLDREQEREIFSKKSTNILKKLEDNCSNYLSIFHDIMHSCIFLSYKEFNDKITKLSKLRYMIIFELQNYPEIDIGLSACMRTMIELAFVLRSTIQYNKENSLNKKDLLLELKKFDIDSERLHFTFMILTTSFFYCYIKKLDYIIKSCKDNYDIEKEYKCRIHDENILNENELLEMGNQLIERRNELKILRLNIVK